jgi:hypothetical protein
LHTRNHAIQATWFLALALPYTVYRPAGEWWGYLRFLLPALPALIMLAAASLACCWQLVEKVSTRRQQASSERHFGATALRSAAGGLLLALSMGWTALASKELSFMDIRNRERIYPESAQWARDHLPHNSLIVCMMFSGTVYYHTRFPIVRYDGFDAGKAAEFRKDAAAQDSPIYAMLWPFEVNDAMHSLGGNWTKVAEIGGQKITILQLAQ